MTNIPGTTRDLIRHDLLIDGLEIRVTDTAGIRPTGDQIEEEGIRRTLNAIETADLVYAYLMKDTMRLQRKLSLI